MNNTVQSSKVTSKQSINILFDIHQIYRYSQRTYKQSYKHTKHTMSKQIQSYFTMIIYQYLNDYQMHF